MGVDRSAIVERESLEQEIEGLDALDVPDRRARDEGSKVSGAPPGRSSPRWAFVLAAWQADRVDRLASGLRAARARCASSPRSAS